EEKRRCQTTDVQDGQPNHVGPVDQPLRLLRVMLRLFGSRSPSLLRRSKRIRFRFLRGSAGRRFQRAGWSEKQQMTERNYGNRAVYHVRLPFASLELGSPNRLFRLQNPKN